MTDGRGVFFFFDRNRISEQTEKNNFSVNPVRIFRFWIPGRKQNEKEEKSMKKKTWKRVAAIGVASVMAAGLFTGCGSKENEASNVTLTENGTYPIVDGEEPLEMTMFTMTMPNIEDFATNDFTKYMEDLTNIKWEFVTGGRDDWESKLTMLLQADDYPDMIFGVSPDIAKYGVDEGIFIPLDEYINEDIMPNYTKLIEENGYDMSVAVETDGQTYSLVNINDCYHCKYARKMWVNTKYLEEMGCEIPTTTDEFLDVCRKFLEYKPAGVAVAGANSGWFANAQNFLLGAYTFIPTTSETFNVMDYVVLDSDTDQVTCVAVSDEYREGLKFLNELYEMGAFYDGNFTQTAEQMKTLINQADEPVLFFPIGAYTDGIDAGTDFYRDYAPMAPIAGPDGTRIAWTMPNYGLSSGAVVITDNCENPEAALRWCDFFYSETGDLCSQYGAEEGVDWVLDPEGKVGLNGEPALYEVLNVYSAETQNHDWQDCGIRVATESYRLGQAVDADVDPYSAEGLERLLYDASAELYEPYAFNTNLINLNELKVTSEENNAVSTAAVEVEKFFSEQQVAFITGAQDINDDAAWQTYVKGADNAGLQTLLDTYQGAYDRAAEGSAE